VSGLGFAASRVKDAQFIQMDARAMPFREEFDFVGAFDVLEHIVEDEAVLSSMHQSLKPGGGILLTVPQHPFLWSEQDVAACHVRRYREGELKRKLEKAGFEVLMTTSFVSLLFPLMMASRLLTKRTTTDPMSELRLPSLTNAFFETIMNCEASMIKLNFRFPFGGSLLMAGRRS
ncbi:MAG TPA: methyltransferase domain-containing protein, partial [Burkholderiales bacterium]|nr:methyltransferase domain-containing protein [Burkholderiales bacterium]